MIIALATIAVLAPQNDPPPGGALIDRPLVVTGVSQHIPDIRELYRVPEGPGPVTPSLYSAHVPRFAFGNLFPSPSPSIQYGAFSSGTSNIISNDNGWAVIPEHEIQWGFLTFSVTTSTVGDEGSIYDLEDEVGGDVFHVFLPGSDPSEGGEIPDHEIGVVQKARDGDDIGIADVQGLDQSLDVLTLDDAISGPADEVFDTFYFTLAPAPGGWSQTVEGWFAPGAPSSATILMVKRIADTNNWGAPTVFKTREELGLVSDSDVITALAVDRVRHKILLATNTADQRLWIAHFDAGWVELSAPYKGIYRDDSGGVFATTVLGLGNGPLDHIDAICANDPGEAELDPRVEALALRKTFGRPSEVEGHHIGHIAACRRRSGLNDQILVYLRGGPDIAPAGSMSVATLFMVTPAGSIPVGCYRAHRNDGYTATRHVVSLASPLLPRGEVTFQWSVLYRGETYVTHTTTIEY